MHNGRMEIKTVLLLDWYITYTLLLTHFIWVAAGFHLDCHDENKK